jgi:glycerophosphoryl diester phosphodiesterase
MSKPIQVWGHRGCRGLGNPPENSLAAFASAIDQGADGIELDVFLTSDDRLVVFHDDTLERMSNGSGAVTSYSFAQLRQLRLKDHGGRLSDLQIPTLDEVLDVVERFRRDHARSERARNFAVNIEIKEMPGKDIATAVAKTLEPRLGAGWQWANFQISSFDFASLRRMKEVAGDLPRGALVHGGHEPWDITPSQLAERVEAIRELEPQTVNLTVPSLTLEAAQLIRSIGALPLVWTCNERSPDMLSREERHGLVARLFDNQVAAIITDDPGPMQRLLGDHFDAR